MKDKKILTKFGTARVTGKGYYQITSSKEGNRGKMLHRLIFADYWHLDDINEFFGEEMDIHHIDGDKLNNELNNLEPIPHDEHTRMHKKGNVSPMYGKHHTEEDMEKMSKKRNSTGYYRVCKQKNSQYKQGFAWVYIYVDENDKPRRISSVDIRILEEKVKARGLKWKIIDEEKAKRTLAESDKNNRRNDL